MKQKKSKLQQKCRIEASDAETPIETQITEIIKILDGEIFGWLLITQQHIFPCEAALHNTREDFIQDLGNAMTCHFATVAIFHQGRRLASEEVEALEKEALGGLGPISKARAQGKI